MLSGDLKQEISNKTRFMVATAIESYRRDIQVLYSSRYVSFGVVGLSVTEITCKGHSRSTETTLFKRPPTISSPLQTCITCTFMFHFRFRHNLRFNFSLSYFVSRFLFRLTKISPSYLRLANCGRVFTETRTYNY